MSILFAILNQIIRTPKGLPEIIDLSYASFSYEDVLGLNVSMQDLWLLAVEVVHALSNLQSPA